MTIPKLLMVFATGLALLSGCDQGTAAVAKDPAPSGPSVVGFGPNCPGHTLMRYVKFDIDDDRVPDWFYVYQCAGGTDSQLELFSGHADRTDPKPMGHHPLIHLDSGVDLYDGCLFFSYQRVLVARKGGKVVDVFVWHDGDLARPKQAPAGTVPCAEARWTGSVSS